MYYILESGHFEPWWKAAWWAFVLTMFAGLLWALVSEFQDFAKYSVDTSTRAVVPASLKFPRVTLCNANGGRDANLMEETGISEPRDEGELTAISQPLEEFITYTRFNKRVYSEDELSQVWTPTITLLGMCFAFATNESIYVPGISAGLTIHAWLNQSSYPDAAAWAGVHVIVDNDTGDRAGSSTSSGMVIVPPGAVLFVGMSMHEMHREEDGPWSNCIPAGADNGTRTVEQCQVECMSCTRLGGSADAA